MNFITNIDKMEYENFVKTNKYKSHFLQSYAWGQFARKEKGLIPHYVGMKKNGNIICASLLLEKKLPLGFSYFYAPRGFVIDFEDNKLLKSFTQHIIKYTKKYHSIFLKIDPDIILKETDLYQNSIELPYNGYKILEDLKQIGYKHLGFTKNFELSQPRYTFRINLNKPLDEIEEKFDKTVKQRIKKAEELDVEVTIGNSEDVAQFYELMKITEHRKDFISHNLSYYKSLYEIWNEDNHCNIFFGKINLDSIINKYTEKKLVLESDLTDLQKVENPSKSQNAKRKELTRQYEKVCCDIEKYESIRNQYGNVITLNAHFIIEYGNKAWVLYAGNHNILSETGSNYKVYQRHLQYCHEKKLKIYDQFGTIGDLKTSNHLYGLHDFKRKFGGNYVEFIGEFDYITNKFMYFIFTKLVPLYRKMKKKKVKK